MAKLTVKNVGPIREAELEVKKHTVFIGPQGSGKSTLAKLIAIGGDQDIFADTKEIIDKYSIGGYFQKETSVLYTDKNYSVDYNGEFNTVIDKDIYTEDFISKMFQGTDLELDEGLRKSLPDLFKSENLNKSDLAKKKLLHFFASSGKGFINAIIKSRTIYIPTERHIFPILSDSIWSLVNADINLPQSIKSFGREFERARNKQNQLQIHFLGIRYSHENGRDIVYSSDQDFVPLSQSASGYQSIIPLLLVVEHQRRQSQRRFIIEEPELNLYPTAQKDLIYNLMSGLDPAVEYKEAEWVITAHSPYVLTSFNTLMLAYKVAQKSDELQAEVEKIIPSRCWINPDEFAAYYVDNGTARSIMGEKTGLIADSELDNVSEDFAGEQDQLMDLYRSVTSA